MPLKKDVTKKIILTGNYVTKLARGGGSADVEGYNIVTMFDALKYDYKDHLDYVETPTDEQIKNANAVLLSIGTDDSEGWDMPFDLPEQLEEKIIHYSEINPNIVVVVNSGRGINMTGWNQKVAAIIYAWYPGQNGNTALGEIIAGKVTPSGKLPITIEKRFEDSPGHSYIHAEEKLYTGWNEDMDMKIPVNNIEYKEGVFVGYRWYDSKKIEPLYYFGYGLSYTTFKFYGLKLSDKILKKGGKLTVEFTVQNSGKIAGAEVAQLYVHDVNARAQRPDKELKGFVKVFLKSGESKVIKINLNEKDFSYWNTNIHNWYAEPGDFDILVGASLNDIRQSARITLTD